MSRGEGIWHFGGKLFIVDDNEFCGACFDPTGHTLFVNIQTPGITLRNLGPLGSRQFLRAGLRRTGGLPDRRRVFHAVTRRDIVAP